MFTKYLLNSIHHQLSMVQKQASLPSSAKTIKLKHKGFSNYQKRISRISLKCKTVLLETKKIILKNKVTHIFLVHHLTTYLVTIINLALKILVLHNIRGHDVAENANVTLLLEN